MSGLGAFAEIALADWMIDTFIYTSLLIGIVLFVRRRVAEYFGPQIAYALWALPLLRFLMPPLVLPAWMRPVEAAPEVASSAAGPAAEPMVFILSEPPVEASEAAMAAAPIVGIDLTAIVLTLWLGGAALFLFWRARDYARMREDLLADSRPVGEAGKVRLVETPAVASPVAFGIRDKVVALPEGFMALIDTRARDMAIAHELEHHRGHDLLANIAAQPLLALHWFNPLAWWGWRAMRRDQEAACDARVVAGRARSERAAYAEVIAGFAAGNHLALAAPMACPVLGEKSIIHRLRSLTMTDISTRRRKFGIAALTTTALALPLTASISYAAPEGDAIAELFAEDAPLHDAAPVAEQDEQVLFDPDVEVVAISDETHAAVAEAREAVLLEPAAPAVPPLRVSAHRDPDLEARSSELLERAHDIQQRANRVAERAQRSGNYARDMAEYGRIMGEYGRVMGEYGQIQGRIGREAARRANVEAREAYNASRREADRDRAAVYRELDCDDADASGVVRKRLSDGREAVMVCNSAYHGMIEASLRSALETVRTAPGLTEEERAEAIEEIHEAMEEVREEIRDVVRAPLPPAPPQPPAVRRTNVSFSSSSRVLQMRAPLDGAFMRIKAAYTADRDEDCEDTDTVEA